MNSLVQERVLVVGSGSIAARHVRNLLQLGAPEVLVITSRDVSSVPLFRSDRVTVVAALPDDPPRLAIIANDTDRHVSSALELARRNTHMLIEKPVAARIDDDLHLLAAEIQARELVVRVGYNLRFLPVFREVERVLREGTIGRVLFARIEAGQHLGAWRPERPYAQGYSASTARGGGVALDLSHELDYMRMLFGYPSLCLSRSGHSGSLGIDSADVFEGIYEFPGGPVCSVHLDYLEATLRRRMRVVGTDGVIECDLAGHRLSVDSKTAARTYESDALFDPAKTYVDELVSFMFEASGGAPGKVRLPTLADGLSILELIVDARQADDLSA